MNQSLINLGNCALVLIDFQERFVPLMPDQHLEARINQALCIGGVLGIPLIVNEQYPKGLGKTSPMLQSTIDKYPALHSTFEKTQFSCCTQEFLFALNKMQLKNVVHKSSSEQPQVILMGIETHVCVLQTAFDLRSQGYQVILLEDCIGSRKTWLHNNGVMQLRSAGFRLANTENLAFETMRDKNHPDFREISNILKDSPLLPS